MAHSPVTTSSAAADSVVGLDEDLVASRSLFLSTLRADTGALTPSGGRGATGEVSGAPVLLDVSHGAARMDRLWRGGGATVDG